VGANNFYFRIKLNFKEKERAKDAEVIPEKLAKDLLAVSFSAADGSSPPSPDSRDIPVIILMGL
jgi:hypothetical protein